MKKNFNWLLIFLAGMIACNPKQEKVHPIRQDITESVYAAGIIKSNNQYKVYSTVNGIITDIPVKEGDAVEKGEIIIRLSNATAMLNNEHAAIVADYATINNNKERLKELQINIDLAKSRMEQDNLLRQRQQKLWDENIGTRNELEQRQLTYTSSVTAYNTARLRYAQLEKEINFQSKQSRKNLEIASVMKNDYAIRSEVSGRIYSILPKKGEMVSTINPVAIIGDAGSFLLELQVDEYDINRVRTGQKILVSLDSYKDSSFEAVVTRIDPIMNEKSKSFTVEAMFTKQPAILYPNLTCETNILVQQKEKVITIPRSYLLPGDSVLINTKEKRMVQTGLKDYQKVEVLSGLTEMDIIYKPDL